MISFSLRYSSTCSVFQLAMPTSSWVVPDASCIKRLGGAPATVGIRRTEGQEKIERGRGKWQGRHWRAWQRQRQCWVRAAAQPAGEVQARVATATAVLGSSRSATLSVGHLQVLKPTRALLDELLERWVVPDASAADVEHGAWVDCPRVGDVLRAARLAVPDE